MSEAVVARKGPFEVELKAGQKYFWCTCGRSANQPFCDGAHKGTGFKPFIFTAQKDGPAYLCGCKHSKSSPFCDGSHNEL